MLTYFFQPLQETLPRVIPQICVNLSCLTDLQKRLFVYKDKLASNRFCQAETGSRLCVWEAQDFGGRRT